MLHAGRVEIYVVIVMPLIFGQSLLILCGYFKYFRASRAFKALLCSHNIKYNKIVILQILRDSVTINECFVLVKILFFSSYL